MQPAGQVRRPWAGGTRDRRQPGVDASSEDRKGGSVSSRRVVLLTTVAWALIAASGCDGGHPAPKQPVAKPSSGSPSTASRSGALTTLSSPATRPPSTTQRPSPTSGTCTPATALATWSVERLAEQTVVVPTAETAVSSVTAEVAAGAGGVILFGTQAPPDLAQALAALNRSARGGIAPLVMTDEEGGAVQRMPNVTGPIPSARQMATTMTPAQIQNLAAQAGRRLRAVGVTMDLAPVLDLDSGPGPNSADALGTRSFSAVEQTAQADGLAFAAGLEAGGVIPVVKHFPGLGAATANTDLAPASTRPWSELQTNGLLPFDGAVKAAVPAVMVANAYVPGLTDQPASVSTAVITGVLRQRLGFHGLVLTDSLSAGALSKAGYSVPRAALDALIAGADMVLFTASPTTVSAVTTQIVDAVGAAVASGRLAKARLVDAVSHILSAKRVSLCP